MKYGIYYAYWEKEWGGNFVPYTEKCARLLSLIHISEPTRP